MRESGIPRDELFITSKIWRDDLGYDRARKSFEDSLQRLGTDYLDLCLIHWPKSGPGDEEWRKRTGRPGRPWKNCIWRDG